MHRARILLLYLPAALACALAMVGARPAAAQSHNPVQHVYYGVELEPHVLWQWAGDEWAWESGLGAGLRVSIPVLEDGPVRGVENNLAVTFGLDWAHFDGDCVIGGRAADCDEDDFWVPVAAQWNIFVNRTLSLFPELGLGFRNAVRSTEGCGLEVCDEADFEVQFALWFGARFRLAEPVALVVRLGTPSVALGVSFLF